MDVLICVSAADGSDGIRERVEDYPIPQRRHLPLANASKLLSQLATDAQHTPLQRLWNDAMAYLMLKTGAAGD